MRASRKQGLYMLHLMKAKVYDENLLTLKTKGSIFNMTSVDASHDIAYLLKCEDK